MNEELNKCIESIQSTIAEIKAMDNIMISDVYAAIDTYGLSKDMAITIFSLH